MARIKIDFDWKPILISIREAMKMIESGAFRPLLKEVGNDLAHWLHREYKGLARTRWQKISPLTYVLRKKSVNPRPIKSIGMGETGARRVLPLIDTGVTLESLLPGKAMNIFELQNNSVTIGSSSPILAANQQPRTHTFEFGPAEESRLKQNVPPRHASPKELEHRLFDHGGRDTAPKGKWNKAYFIFKNALKKRAGKPTTIPARRLPTKPPKVIVTKLRLGAAKLLRERLRDIFRGAL